jgi:hypothetical protein
MPGKHLGKIHDPNFLLKKTGLYLYCGVRAEGDILADSA